MIINNINYSSQSRKILSNNIAYFRIERGWTQEDLAEKLGTNSVYVSNLENAKKNIRIDYIDKLTKVFGISPEQLFIVRKNITNHRIDLQ